MKLNQLKNIIKEAIKDIQKEQQIPTNPASGGNIGCRIPARPQGPYPNQFQANDWRVGFDQRATNIGCSFVRPKYMRFRDKLEQFQSRPGPQNCAPLRQNLLQYKLNHIRTSYSQCI